MTRAPYSFLSDTVIEKLWHAVRNSLPRDIRALDAISMSAKRYVLFSLFGYDLLLETSARRGFLDSLTEPNLMLVAAEVGIGLDSKRYDVLIEIASLTFSHSSKLTSIFRRLLSVPNEYLPQRDEGTSVAQSISPIRPLFALFDYQEELSELVQNALRSKEYPTFLVQLPTGAGKTRTALDGIIQSIVTGHIQSVLWLAHSVELCVQACDSFENTWKHTGDRDFQLVRLWGSLKLKSDDFLDSFVVGSFSKVTNIFKAKSDDWARLVKDVDLIVIDEAHKAQAPTIQELLSCFKENDVKIMGLTATPGRGASSLSENLDLVHTFKHLFDSKLLGDDPITTLQERGILSRTKHEFVEINTSNVKPGSLQDEYDFSNRLLKQLASDENRNQQIVDLVARKVGEGKPTIVFACSVEHAKHLALLCAKKGLLSSSVHFKMRSAHRSKIIKSFTSGDIAVITNFGVLSTGFDAPKTGCVVITRPTTSIVLYSQMVGRGLRGPLMGGTETCEVVDVRDNAVAFGDLDEVYNYFKHYWTD